MGRQFHLHHGFQLGRPHGLEFDEATATTNTDSLPEGVYNDIAQLPTGLSALAFGYSYSKSSPHGSNPQNFGAGDAPGAVVFSNFSGGAMNVAVTIAASGPASLKWAGSTGGGVWDVNNTPNFSGSKTTFSNSDNVTFDDSGSGGTVAIASGGVAPGSLTFSNTAKSYELTGGPITGPVSLVLSGSGSLVLDNTNDFTGGVTVESGRLFAATPGALPAGSVLTVGAGGVFDFDPFGGRVIDGRRPGVHRVTRRSVCGGARTGHVRPHGRRRPIPGRLRVAAAK